MRPLVLAAAALALSACTNKPKTGEPINTQVTRMMDVTGDGQPETVTLFIKAANSHAPVIWLLNIDSGGTTIFERDGDDTEEDALFDNRDALPGCPDYLACKNEYYFESMLGNLIDGSWDPEDFLDMRQGGKLPPSVTRELASCCNLSIAQVAEAAADLENRIKTHRALILTPPISPTETGPRMIYSTLAKQFISLDADQVN